MPVDAVPDMRPPPRGGDIVLTLRGGEYGELLAEKYLEAKHDPDGSPTRRNRFTSHFFSCPNADAHRHPRDE
jgi:hypothetical protein